MIHLQLLGSIDLRGPGDHELRAVLAQPKRLALLAYLGAASPIGPHRRDTLLALFWPENDQEHARSALSQAVRFLRRALGEAAIVSRTNEELALDETLISVDVRAFRKALEEQRLDQALQLYQGELLPSFFLPQAPGFEEWLERERAQLRLRAAAAARSLAERHESARHMTQAIACARRAVELSNGDERPLRRLLELLDRLGDRAGALRTYEDFARRLAAELQVEPAPETIALIERIRSSAPTARRTSPAPVATGSEPDQSPLSRIAVALAGRYKVERQLGVGAMAIVALAQDLRHGRRVAIKVLRPELSALMGPDRFLREIDIAASLTHPHILPLHDSGEGEGLLYYVMPYVEGESLRGRLEREGQLPLEEALQIAREVADGLAYAHRRGFIHRDIKPENILLTGDHAVIADFGIARAIGSAAGERLAAPGAGTGTPAYMSPEQAAGDGTVDERTDIYALGCVLYEMLAGNPPSKADPPALSTVRPDVSPALEQAIARARAKVPGDRFPTAAEFAAALSRSLEAPLPVDGHSREVAAAAGGRLGRRQTIAVLASIAVLLLVLGLTLSRRGGTAAPPVDRRVVAVVPFRVTGADSSLGFLREGMLDLLASKLSGTNELRTVDPRTLLRAWSRAGGSEKSDIDRRSALGMSRQLGAGRLLQGEVVGTSSRLILNASLSEADGDPEPRASVVGPLDSLTWLVDQLAAQLLALGAGEHAHRLAALTTTSLPALRSYLDGRVAYRRGDYAAAAKYFDRAMELDSTFALAGLGRRMAGAWLSDSLHTAAHLAWRHRSRLSPRDLLLLKGYIPFPVFTNLREDLGWAEEFVGLAADDPEGWVRLADHTYHYGLWVGMPDASERSLQAFRRALALDSSFAPAVGHLPELYYERGDTAGARRALNLYFRVISSKPLTAARRWFAWRALGDTLFGKVSLTHDSLLTRSTLLVNWAVHYGIGLADAESVLTLRRARVSNDTERAALQEQSWTLYLVRGQPQRAKAAMPSIATPSRKIAAILAALYGDADTAVGNMLAREVSRRFSTPIQDSDDSGVRLQYAAAAHDLEHGSLRASRAAVSVWRGCWSPGDSSRARFTAAHLAVLLDAQLAAASGRADLPERLTELDSVLQAGIDISWFSEIGNLVLARLWHQQGRADRALRTIRRRIQGLAVNPMYPASLQEEGRYAALTGDRAGAIRAYRHYLTLRSEPEPVVRSKVDEARAELAALEGTSTNQ